MNPANPQGWLSYAIPAIIIGIVLAFRFRNMNRERPLKIERLWIVPALYCVVAGVVFWNAPPVGMVWLYCAVALIAGAALGWQRGRMMRINVDPESHEIRQKASPAATLLILGLILVRSGARNAESLGIPGVHVDVMAMTDILIALALGLLTAQRIEMYLRARRLLAAARGA
ncbi:CcdC protein domain-containing protein [Sphingomonas sp.]|jgi:membrane protein CcdC involved in cytochrome C biogenesis|uniref:CcdC protein domain-containing protein n=1 Tax=Sphingomonas sp. TaxID=28214 RepID=UPI002ED7A8EC